MEYRIENIKSQNTVACPEVMFVLFGTSSTYQNDTDIDATAYLRSSKKNHEMLCKSIKNMENGNYTEITLEDFKKKYLR